MIDVKLRPAVENDILDIKKLVKETGINPTSLDWRRFIIAEISGNFTGCGQIKPHADGTNELATIAVVAKERNRGIGSMIIQDLLKNSSRPIYLNCMESLGTYYNKFGFRIVKDDELPKYFRRISQLASLITRLGLMHEGLLVMVVE